MGGKHNGGDRLVLTDNTTSRAQRNVSMRGKSRLVMEREDAVQNNERRKGKQAKED